jgi:hypothetical protein
VGEPRRGAKNGALLRAILPQKRSFCQDRLGTNIRNVENQWLFLQDCLSTFIDFCQNNASGLVPSGITLNGTVPLDFVSTHEYAGGANNVNNAESIVQHLSKMKPVATQHGLYHIMTEWGGSYLNGAGTGSGVGDAVGGTANFDYHTPVGWRGEQQDTHETAAFILQTILKSHEANLTWGEREATSYWGAENTCTIMHDNSR